LDKVESKGQKSEYMRDGLSRHPSGLRDTGLQTPTAFCQEAPCVRLKKSVTVCIRPCNAWA